MLLLHVTALFHVKAPFHVTALFHVAALFHETALFHVKALFRLLGAKRAQVANWHPHLWMPICQSPERLVPPCLPVAVEAAMAVSVEELALC